MLWWPLSWARRLVVLAVVLAVVGAAALTTFYLSDGRVDATVVDKRCGFLQENSVTVETKWFGVRQTKPITASECALIQVGFFVQYFVRSERTVIYNEEGGRCVWDSQSGPCPN